jgi:hypothetical protein
MASPNSPFARLSFTRTHRIQGAAVVDLKTGKPMPQLLVAAAATQPQLAV